MGGSDPTRPELGAEDPSLRRGYTELLFMNDGRTMYKAYAGIQRSEYWAEVQELPLDQALALTDYVAASVEAHRQNP